MSKLYWDMLCISIIFILEDKVTSRTQFCLLVFGYKQQYWILIKAVKIEENKIPKLDHVAIEVSDMDASIDFYTTKLGFEFISRNIDEKEKEEYCYLKSGNFYLELLHDKLKKILPRKKAQRPYYPHICLATGNMEETIKTLQSKNITIIHGLLIIENEATWVYFVDPDYNVLEFIQRL